MTEGFTASTQPVTDTEGHIYQLAIGKISALESVWTDWELIARSEVINAVLGCIRDYTVNHTSERKNNFQGDHKTQTKINKKNKEDSSQDPRNENHSNMRSLKKKSEKKEI